MAAVQRTLVHKQFNSPMGLYSPQNVKETLDRELKAFGASGIEIDDQNSKPLNLANSAVLRAVEEEEEMKCGYKRVAWPPVSEERIAREFTPQPQGQFSPSSPQQQQQQQQQQQPAAAPVSGSVAAPHQGPIYNNVHPVARPTSPCPSQYQQQQQQHPQTHYQQQPSAHYNPQQHQQREPPQQHSCVPIQYTQAQFNTQPSRDFSASPTFAHEPHYAPQQQQHFPTTTTTTTHPSYEYDRQQPPSSSTLAIDTPCATAGWRPICPPVAKPTGYVLNQYQHQHQQPPPPPPPSSEAAFGSCVNTEHDYAPLTLHHQQQPQQPQQEQLQQPTYRANSYDHYQPPTVQQQQHQQAPSPQKYQAVSNPAQYNHQPQQQPQQPYQYRAQSQQQQSAVPRQQQPNWSAQSQQQQPAYHAQSNQYPSQQPQPPYQFESHSPQYNSYSQPQTQQQQQHPYPEDYRGGSPGIITLRKEAPVSQKAAPVFTSQPAAVNYKGGNNMRGDLKWPPPEYKEQAARENEERRQLALGPVCRPRKIKRDYTEFFAKNQLNSYYPGYKVPPGTQHMV